jgi:DNA transformation protein and related proteins
MALRPEYRAFVVELFTGFGTVKVRPMFGAAGIFAGDIMLGVVADEKIYLKTDARSRKAYEGEGAKPFTFFKSSRGETIITSYFEVPERLYDDADELAQWARRAHEIALNSPTGRRKQRARTDRQPVRRRKRS